MKIKIMRHKQIILPVILVIGILVSVLQFTGMAAASVISLSSSVQISFPDAITFNISAQSDEEVMQLRLHYIVEQQNYAEVVSEGWAQFTPAKFVRSQWVWDMRKSGLPPDAVVTYWWTALDAAGKMAQTVPATITFADTRFNWRSISRGLVTLYWYSGNEAFAESLMTASQQGLERIEDSIGAVPHGQVKIFIYGSASDLQSSHLFSAEWVGGLSYSGYNVVVVGVSTNQLSFGLRAVPHELTHWVVGQITFNNYGAGLPVWLSEGLATYFESPSLNTSYRNALDNAIKNNQLLSVRSLSSPFSAVSAVAYISYGQSYSIVSFMISKYGKEKMQSLLEVFRQGATYDDALMQVYGFDQDGLDRLWRHSLSIYSEQ